MRHPFKRHHLVFPTEPHALFSITNEYFAFFPPLLHTFSCLFCLHVCLSFPHFRRTVQKQGAQSLILSSQRSSNVEATHCASPQLEPLPLSHNIEHKNKVAQTEVSPRVPRTTRLLHQLIKSEAAAFTRPPPFGARSSTGFKLHYCSDCPVTFSNHSEYS